MKAAYTIAKTESQRFSCSTAVKCILFIVAVLSVLNQCTLPQSKSNLRESDNWPAPIEETLNIDSINSGSDNRLLVKIAQDQSRDESTITEEETMEEISETENRTITDIEASIPAVETKDENVTNSSLTFSDFEIPGEIKNFAESTAVQPLVSLDQEQNQTLSSSVISAENQKNTLICDYTQSRFDVCSLEGDIRVLGTASSILVVHPPPIPLLNTSSYKIRPFGRKWEGETMSHVRELTIQQSIPDQSPTCDVRHDVPALIFDIGGFPFNLYHAYTDLLMPLFIGSYQYNGKVQFAATNYNLRWIMLYNPLLQKLSDYPIIDLDSESLVHCFPSAEVGIRSRGPLAIEPNMSMSGYTMQDFRQFIRSSISLERAQVEIIDRNSNRKPRVCILLRKGTRAFVNEKEIIEMIEGVGFEVVPVDTETTKSFPKIAHIINSCEVLMGLHGAGMANMLYLPNNGTLIQILPWGNLRKIGWGDYGEPTKDMGIKYVEYEIKVEESTLIEKYPRDHQVLTNPQEIHKQGWEAMYKAYLVEQSVKLDVDRFRVILVEIFNSINQ